MSNPAAGCYEVGGAFLPCSWSSLDVFEMFVWGPARNGVVARAPSIGKRVPPTRVVPMNIPNPFDQYLDIPVERKDTTYTPGHWTHPLAPSLNITFAQSPTANPQKSRVEPDDLKAYRARIGEMLQNKNCADYIQQLLNEVETQTGMASGDILTTFDAIRFYWANTGGAYGGHAYWEEMGTVRAADIMNTINTERMGGSRANQMDRRAFLISETTQAFLGETMHHLSQGGRMYSDPQMANALNAVLARQGLDIHKNFPDKTATDVDNASRYWHPKVASACPPPRK